MAKRALVLFAVWLAAVLVSVPTGGPARAGATASSASSRIERAVLGGVAIALSPVGVLVGCGGGGPSGPSRTSATAVAQR